MKLFGAVRSFAMMTVLLLAGLTYSARSEACCGDGPVAAAGAIQAGGTVSGTISTATGTLTGWLEKIDLTIQQGFGQLYVELARQTAEQRTIQQGMVATQSQMYLEKARADSQIRYQVSPRACFETAGGAAVATASAETAQNVNDLNRSALSRTLYTVNTAADVNQMLATHQAKYCSAQDAALGRCTAAADDMQNADVRADTLYSHTSLSPDQITAAQQLHNNIINPIPTQSLPKGLESSAAGKLFVAGQYMEQASLSVASNSLNQAIGVRTPVQGLGTAAQMDTPDISEMGLMEAQVIGRFESPAWYAMVAGMSQENLLREMNKQQALKLWMDLKAYKQQERIEGNLATLVALAVRRDAAVNLKEARAAAVRSN